MKSFLIALQFLTVIPVTHSFIASDKQLGYSPLFYPVIGLLIGSLLVLATFLLANIPIQIQAVIILILWVLLTGGLHLDGLADCADAWVGGLGNKQRSLDIMKDPAAGPVAVVALVLLLLFKWSVITHILEIQAIEVLLVTPMLGRLAILILMLSTNYIRPAGLGASITANLPKPSVNWLALFGIVFGIYCLGLLPIIFMLVMIVCICKQSKKRLGGVTGDVYGAAVELVEVSVLMGILA
ncbi:MAG: adenosylcobinamide-GDP ribazoletransferase [Methylococcaceae bacterium]|nr:adenosylcobinamide-GDP ribazoletransferase [Methylococcaceae bacterium]